MERGAHRRLVDVAVKRVRGRYKPGTLIRKAWEKNWVEAHANPDGAAGKPFPPGVRASWLFSADHRFVYGALVAGRPARDIRDYREMSGRYSYSTRYETFKRQPPYRRVADVRPVSETVARDLGSAAPRLVQMKDVSDLAVIDVLLSQQDRVGNISYRKRRYTWNGDQVSVRPGDEEDAGEAGAQAVRVKEMVLRDNDCGVVKSNLAQRHRWLAGVAHMAPETYRRVLWLEARGAAPETEGYFRREILLSDADYRRFRDNLAHVSETLRRRCGSGALHLDLDLETHLRGGERSPGDAACELPPDYVPAPPATAP